MNYDATTTFCGSPESIDEMLKLMEQFTEKKPKREASPFMSPPPDFNSLPVRFVSSPWIDPVRRWVPPKNDGWITYEPSDYWWLEKYGFGHYEMVRPMYAIQMPRHSFICNSA